MASFNDILRGLADATLFPIVNDFCMDHQICLNNYIIGNSEYDFYEFMYTYSNGDGVGYGTDAGCIDGDGFGHGDAFGHGDGDGEGDGDGWGESPEGNGGGDGESTLTGERHAQV